MQYLEDLTKTLRPQYPFHDGPNERVYFESLHRLCCTGFSRGETEIYPKAEWQWGCLIGKKAPLSRSNAPYMRIHLGIPHSDESILAHQAVMILKEGLDEFNSSRDQNLEISHLCHRSMCLNPRHLVYETTKNNSSRKSCKDSFLCNMPLGAHNEPHCLRVNRRYRAPDGQNRIVQGFFDLEFHTID